MVCLYKEVAQTYMRELVFKLAWTYMVTFPIFNTDVKNDLVHKIAKVRGSSVGEGLIPIRLQYSLCMNSLERRRRVIWIVDSVQPHDSGPRGRLHSYRFSLLYCCKTAKNYLQEPC